jgi:hypothetical protein
MANYETLTQICQTMVRWLNEPNPTEPGWPPETWQSFQRASQVHGVAPLLYTKLRGVGWLEPEMKAWLARQYDFNSQRLTRLHTELKEILALFNANTIPLIPLKGSILSTRYYPDPAWRPMADLDLLIQPKDASSSLTLLAQLGYQQERVNWKHITLIKPDNRQIISRHVEHPDNPREVDLHLYCREMFGGPAINLTEMIWDNTDRGNLLGESAWLIKPDLLWLHSLIHTSSNIWTGGGRLIHLLDIAQLAPWLENPAAALNSIDARFTYFALLLTRKCFPEAVDDSLLELCQPRVSTAFHHWANSLDLANSSYLSPWPATPYLIKILRFYEGRPQDILQALQFIFLPTSQQLALSYSKPAYLRPGWPVYFWLPFLWLTHVGRSLGLVYNLVKSGDKTEALR